MVPGEIGSIPEHREVTGTPPGGIWALLGLSGREGKEAKKEIFFRKRILVKRRYPLEEEIS